MSFPDDWIVAEVGDAARGWLDRWLDSDGLSDTVLVGQRRGAFECSLIGSTAYATSAPAYTSLTQLVDDQAYWAARDPFVAESEVVHLDLPVGPAACLDALHTDGMLGRDYFFHGDDRWFVLSCHAYDAPDDRWLSIAESFEILASR